MTFRPRAPALAALGASLLAAGCGAERAAAPRQAGLPTAIYVKASLVATSVATIVVRVSAEDIEPALVFNLVAEEGTAAGMIHVPAGAARTVVAQAFDGAGMETHRGELTLDVRPGPNNPPVTIVMLPIAGAQPLELRLGTVTVTIAEVPESLRVGEAAALSVVVTDADGAPVAFKPAEIHWATATPGTLAVGESGVVTGVVPGDGRVTATYADVADVDSIRVRPRPGFFAAPDGASGGDGSWEQPWDLATVLSGAGGRIAPGAVVWLRGGVYAGDFRSTLAGSADQPIVVRRYPGERATIEGRLRADGAHTTYWGFEIRQADPMAPDGPPALEAYAPGGRYVNLVIHDAGENGISFRTASGVSEIYGCIIYNNGNTEGLDHGIYASSEPTVEAKWITDNILFNNIAAGVQVFGDETHSTITSVTVNGNVAFNNSSIAVARTGGEENILVGGDNNVVENITVTDNLLYFTPGLSTGMNLVAGVEREVNDPPVKNASVTIRGNYVIGGRTLFSLQEWEQATVDGNTFVAEVSAQTSSRMVRLNTNFQPSLAGVAWTNNTQYSDPLQKNWRYADTLRTWQGFRDATGLGGTDIVTASELTETKIFIRPNKYEAGRAHIAIHNPTGAAAVSVDVSGVLQPGDEYEVRNVHDVFGKPLLSGRYSGGSLDLPMNNVAPPPPAGRGAAPVTGPYFNAFLLTRLDR